MSEAVLDWLGILVQQSPSIHGEEICWELLFCAEPSGMSCSWSLPFFGKMFFLLFRTSQCFLSIYLCVYFFHIWLFFLITSVSSSGFCWTTWSLKEGVPQGAVLVPFLCLHSGPSHVISSHSFKHPDFSPELQTHLSSWLLDISTGASHRHLLHLEP